MSLVTKCTLLIQVASTLSMVGLIWFVQVVHYPLFARVGHVEFPAYEADHQRLTTYVVAPLMLAELATAVLLFWWRPPGVPTWLIAVALATLLSIWVSTYLVQVPQHRALSESFDASVQARLVSGNWFRTIAWTTRGLLVLGMLTKGFSKLG